MRTLKISYVAVAVLSVFILFSTAISFANSSTTQDDIKSMKDSIAAVQKYDPYLAKKIDELADKVSAEQAQVVSEPTAYKSTPRITKAASSDLTLSPETKDFWIIDSPKEWPSQIMGGIRSGSRQKIKGYSDNLIPFVGTKATIIFADVKTVLGAANTNEENIGLGARSLLFDEKLILGANFFYDTKYTENKVRHNQLGFGLEGLSKWVDARANFYFPISGKKYLDNQAYYGFRSRSLALVTPYEEPLAGLDYEGGILIPYLSEYIETRAFIGGYNYFPSEGKGINGIKGRIELRPVKAFTVNLELTKDNYNSTEFFIEGIVSVPLDTMNVFKITNPLEYVKDYLGYKKGIRPLRERMVDRVVRDIDVVIDPNNPTAESTVHNLTYVDNSNSGTEDGTLEHPYKTISDGVTNVVGDKWVYVDDGSGNYNEAVTLTSGVVLWGSGYNGGFSGLVTSGIHPIISGGSSRAYGITLNDNNTVMGVKVTATTTAGIYGVTPDTTATLSHNIITANTGDGIWLYPSSGGLTATLTDNTITSNTKYGVNLYSHGGTMSTTLTGNTIALNNGTSSGSSGDGYISDMVTTTDIGTGLIWASDGIGVGCNGGGTLTWADAGTWADGLTFGGYSDWRMPTIAELTSIANYMTYNPAINATAFPNTVSGLYWSSTTVADYPGYAWHVYSSSGDAYFSLKTNARYVRPVRGS